jgi:hypothetical protein
MTEIRDLLVTLGGFTAFVVALFGIGRAMRADNAKRFDAYTLGLEARVTALENKLNLSERRRYQLEAILRSAGLPIPPWPDPEFDTVDPGTLTITHHGSLS